MYLKKVFSLVILAAVFFSAQAQYQPNNNSVEEVLENRKEIFFRFHASEFTGKIPELTRKISIDRFDEEDGIVYAYADESGYAFLEENDVEIELLYNPSELISLSGFKGDRGTYDWDEYPTYEGYVDMMNQFETDFPELCRVENFGTTTDGRELLVARITDNPDNEENEPEFFYTSTMHGDETTGYVLMLRLIDYLLTKYGTDDRITNMVDHMEIWINPNANP
ncbi:MAG TPA: M14 family zinc carboxypeptidase, partial [Bacteroidales bacterium]|nr:M14 family zinc carboxypeptidase [Bacteroidales bacterium]